MTKTKPDLIRTRVTKIFGARVLILMSAFAATAIACSWSMLTEHSVRFNPYRSGRGFYRLPPLPIMYEPKTGKEITVESLSDYYDFDGVAQAGYPPVNDEETESEDSKTWNEARSAVESNDLAKAGGLFEKFLELTKLPSFEGLDYERRNSARDILDALEALKHGSKIESVRTYIDVRYAACHNNGESLQDVLGSESTDKNLQDNWEYLRATFLVRDKKPDEALAAFDAHSSKYPSSEKHQAVLYMIAKLTMESSHSFGNTACGIQEEETPDDAAPATSTAEPVEKCRDANWQKAVEDFQRLMRQYPNGRYFNDARGWLAYLYRRGGNRAEALAEYYRMLGHPTDWSVRLEAKKSLQMIGHAYDDAILDKVESLIADDQNAAMAYAYHRIYNHAIDLTYEEPEQWRVHDGNGPEQETERVSKTLHAGSHELERVARFATTMVKRHPGAHVSGSFLLRVAEAQLELQNFGDALNLAKKALASGIDGDLRTEALWTKGSAEHAAKDFRNARITFTQLIRESPKSKLTEGARRLLAMTAEDQDDLETALEQYLALGYKFDVAYFVDVLISTDRLARFVDSHRDDASYNKLLYSLALRYAREKRWNEARITLRKVVTSNDVLITDWDSENNTSKIAFAKSPDYEAESNADIKTGWVMQDLKTIDVMENFDRAIMSAPDDEARAEAMYQLASFQFDGDDLLFYNPILWEGQRQELLSEIINLKTMRQPGEAQRLFDYSQSHDTLARSIPIYLEIVNRYPNTRAAKDALYTAAVAHERLSNLNNYWRDVYQRGLFAGGRHVSYVDVKSAYPRYQLPRGTDGWQASTRTVNGGPGWAARPKPLPRETREHKVKRIFNEFAEYISTKITTGVLPNIESKVDSSMNWFGSMIEAAIYGVLSAIGLSTIFLAGFEVHTRRAARLRLAGAQQEPSDGSSRVDKFIK
ncbi:MAG: outer membrane protein assembly factor BamD [Acidobacteriota bacterium]